MQLKFESSTPGTRPCAETGDRGVALSSGSGDGCARIPTPVIGFSRP